jgi:hypothetical protein
MSRSYRHSPFVGIAVASSDKVGKVHANRCLRVAFRVSFADCRDYEDYVGPVIREVSNVWDFPKDGKQRIRDSWVDHKKYLRK